MLRCLKEEMKSVENDECITEVYTFVKLGILPEESSGILPIAGKLLLCNSTLCNTRENLERACNPGELLCVSVQILPTVRLIIIFVSNLSLCKWKPKPYRREWSHRSLARSDTLKIGVWYYSSRRQARFYGCWHFLPRKFVSRIKPVILRAGVSEAVDYWFEYQSSSLHICNNRSHLPWLKYSISWNNDSSQYCPTIPNVIWVKKIYI